MEPATPASEPGHLFGASGRHARVVVMTVTDKELSIARDVFGACGELVEVDDLAAYTNRQFADKDHLPFVLVRASDRGNLPMARDIQEWMFQFRPQAFLLVGTAGGVWRPSDPERTRWQGPLRGDVIVSEFVHFGDYRKVTPGGSLLRYHRLEQPATHLLQQSRPLITEPGAWHRWLGATWEGVGRLPTAREQEIVVGEQIQDDPLDATQQFLMRTFDRAGATEMESAGVAQALHSLRKTAMYAPMYLSLRGVSDLIWACGTDGPLTEADVARAKEFDAAQSQEAGGDAVPGTDKASERHLWTPRASAAASAFALGLVERLVRRRVGTMLGHPAIPGFDLTAVGADV